ncbi:Uncharacterised protein [Clostridium perfringens]|nr:Uncharacterised protein [Clostridium perfringens]
MVIKKWNGKAKLSFILTMRNVNIVMCLLIGYIAYVLY